MSMGRFGRMGSFGDANMANMQSAGAAPPGGGGWLSSFASGVKDFAASEGGQQAIATGAQLLGGGGGSGSQPALTSNPATSAGAVMGQRTWRPRGRGGSSSTYIASSLPGAQPQVLGEPAQSNMGKWIAGGLAVVILGGLALKYKR